MTTVTNFNVARYVREIGIQALERTGIIARDMGVHVTDLRAIELLYLGGEMTAGELGSRLNLTTGSMTALIKRLVTAQLIIRRSDDKDSRRVILAVNPERIAEVRTKYDKGFDRFSLVYEKYSPEQMALIESFLADLSEAAVDATRLTREDLGKK